MGDDLLGSTQDYSQGTVGTHGCVTENLHVTALTPLVAPQELKEALPLTPAVSRVVVEGRRVIREIIAHRDPRLLVVVGPCSIHDPAAALVYAEQLAEAQHRVGDKLYLVMRTYFEKPRTTTGWRGLINDPHMDGSFVMEDGLRIARELLLRINTLGVPTAVEVLDPVTTQYFADLVSWGAIGARTAESQTHRALASGLSMPIGFKNGTDGNLQIAVDALVSARAPHSFLGVDQDGRCCVVKTTGNPDGVIILRGGKSGTNYHATAVLEAQARLRAAALPTAIVIDCSHANSRYDPAEQELVWKTVIRDRELIGPAVVGLMVESNLLAGKQAVPADLGTLRYGVSVTDGCLDWAATERLLAFAYDNLTG
jgi:3-deoxy-7-phosphoheptulonate synthase